MLWLKKNISNDVGRKEKLEKELEELKTTKRAEIIERIKIARSFGDLSENSEYEAAKNEQSILEGRIKEVTNMLNHAEIIDNGAIAEDEVAIGKTVTFKKKTTNRKHTKSSVLQNQIRSTARFQTNLRLPKDWSDIKVGETVTVETPGGDMQVKIISVE